MRIWPWPKKAKESSEPNGATHDEHEQQRAIENADARLAALNELLRVIQLAHPKTATEESKDDR